jgi:hypothetical protein
VAGGTHELLAVDGDAYDDSAVEDDVEGDEAPPVDRGDAQR